MEEQETIRSANPENIYVYIKKVWQYRSMIWVLGLRDLKIKYAQTFLGLSWSLIQPLTALIIYTVFFDLFMHMRRTIVPYSLFVFSGIICWNLFSYIVNTASTSLLSNQNLISKIYFPKIILPLFTNFLSGRSRYTSCLSACIFMAHCHDWSMYRCLAFSP